MVIAVVFGYIDVNVSRWWLLEGIVDGCFLVWGQMYLLCVGIQVAVLVFGIKYMLALFLCAVGCVCRMLGIGPGLSSMSPHFNSSNLLMK